MTCTKEAMKHFKRGARYTSLAVRLMKLSVCLETRLNETANKLLKKGGHEMTEACKEIGISEEELKERGILL